MEIAIKYENMVIKLEKHILAYKLLTVELTIFLNLLNILKTNLCFSLKR